MSLLNIMSSELSLDEKYILSISIRGKKNYSYYDIPKKNGRTRRIYHPSPALKTLQYWLVKNIFNKCFISENSAAYSKGCSIKKNAEIHKDNKFILHMDVEKFFDSINIDHLKNMLEFNLKKIEPIKLEEEDIKLISMICLFDKHLVIGSVCAPQISNCVMYQFDIELNEILAKYAQIKYTRYADDIIISSPNYLNIEIINLVTTQLKKHSFNVNTNKTKFMSPSKRRSVTGLVLDGNRVSIGYKRHKEIKKMLYKKLTKDIGDNNVILGHLFFLKDIEPEYFNKLIVKYSIYGNILLILKSLPTNVQRFDITSMEEASSAKENL